MLDLHQLQVGRKRVAQGIERVAVREHDDRVRTLPQEFDEHIRFFAAKGPKVVALEVEGDRVAIARIEDDRRRRVAAVFLKLRDPPQRCSIACVPGNEEVVAQADEGKGKRRDDLADVGRAWVDFMEAGRAVRKIGKEALKND